MILRISVLSTLIETPKSHTSLHRWLSLWPERELEQNQSCFIPVEAL
jgi:hypothetical protein